MNDNQKLGARIRELRKKRNLTQEQLGEKSGISYKYIGNIERGNENPTFDALIKIARGLDVEAWELLIFEHTESSPSALRKEIKTLLAGSDLEDMQRAMKIIRALSR